MRPPARELWTASLPMRERERPKIVHKSGQLLLREDAPPIRHSSSHAAAPNLRRGPSGTQTLAERPAEPDALPIPESAVGVAHDGRGRSAAVIHECLRFCEQHVLGPHARFSQERMVLFLGNGDPGRREARG